MTEIYVKFFVLIFLPLLVLVLWYFLKKSELKVIDNWIIIFFIFAIAFFIVLGIAGFSDFLFISLPGNTNSTLPAIFYIGGTSDIIIFNRRHMIYVMPVYLSILMLIYSFFISDLLQNNKINSQNIDDASDSPYILGFCCTLFALFVTFANFNISSPDSVDTPQLIAQSAAALLTTLSGMLARVWLRGVTKSVEITIQVSEINKLLNDTKSLLVSSAAEQLNFSESLKTAKTNILNQQEALSRLNSLSTSSKVDHAFIYNYQKKTIKQLSEISKSINTILQNTNTTIQQQDNALVNITEKIDTNTKAVDESLRKTNIYFDDIFTALRNAADYFKRSQNKFPK